MFGEILCTRSLQFCNLYFRRVRRHKQREQLINNNGRFRLVFELGPATRIYPAVGASDLCKGFGRAESQRTSGQRSREPRIHILQLADVLRFFGRTLALSLLGTRTYFRPSKILRSFPASYRSAQIPGYNAFLRSPASSEQGCDKKRKTRR